VIIPTLGNPLLVRAVRSALDQTYPELDVIVCADGPEAAAVANTLTDPRVRVLIYDERRGQREARFSGAEATTAPYVAFLDDDDLWHPRKIERQVAAAMAMSGGGARSVVLCRSNRVAPDGRHQQVVPKRLLGPDERVADYLFVRRRIRPGEAAATASMFMIARSLLLDLPPLPGSPFLHEDWALLIALADRPEVQLAMVDDVLIDYVVYPIGESASSSMAWQLSDEWFELWRERLTKREWAEGLLSVTAVLAVEQGDRRGALSVARKVRRAGGAMWRAWGYFVLVFLLPKPIREGINETVEKVSTRLTRQWAQ
jgi:glycosyltransferase involved in cell wall biosynthesis